VLPREDARPGAKSVALTTQRHIDFLERVRIEHRDVNAVRQPDRSAPLRGDDDAMTAVSREHARVAKDGLDGVGGRLDALVRRPGDVASATLLQDRERVHEQLQ
jgi:hypothetical protein